MNRIFKVIWSKTKHCYIVVSEYAKANTKAAHTGLRTTAAAVAAAAMLLAPVNYNYVWAADTATVTDMNNEQQTVYTKDRADSTFATSERLQADVSKTNLELTTETTERKAADTALDTRITSVKEYLQNETENNYVSKAGLASELEVKDAGVVKADQKIGENVTALGKALNDETAARIGADAAQDKVIQQVNDNLVQSVNTINKNVADGFTALNQADTNEAKARAEADTAEQSARKTADNELNERITNEANAIHDEIKAGDKALDDRITSVKEYLEGQTADQYVSKADAAVQDGAVVKAANTIGDNVTKLDAALAKETAARLGADAAQDKVIQQVNDNLVASVNTINESVKNTNENMAAGFTALSQADANEAATREAADTEIKQAMTDQKTYNGTMN